MLFRCYWPLSFFSHWDLLSLDTRQIADTTIAQKRGFMVLGDAHVCAWKDKQLNNLFRGRRAAKKKESDSEKFACVVNLSESLGNLATMKILRNVLFRLLGKEKVSLLLYDSCFV